MPEKATVEFWRNIPAIEKSKVFKPDALPEAYRVVFILRALEEFSVEETAGALGIPEATVRTRFFRARRVSARAERLCVPGPTNGRS